MSNELIAFLCGGIFIGVILSALFVVISNKTEGENK